MDKLINDYENLCAHAHMEQSMTRKGNALVRWATDEERYKTRNKINVSFAEVMADPQKYLTMPSARKLYTDEIEIRHKSEDSALETVTKLYLGGIPGYFKPSTSAYFLSKYVPRKAVLDPTMGWGGRLVGATAVNVPKYIGIDSNVNLSAGYNKLMTIIRPRSRTEIHLIFKDATLIDYSAFEYDVVLTSLPYFNHERYEYQQTRTKQEWIEYFYRPLLKRVWESLMEGGYMLLNVDRKTYTEAVQPVLGDCDEAEPIIRKQKFQKIPERNKNINQTEMMYVWRKPSASHIQGLEVECVPYREQDSLTSQEQERPLVAQLDKCA